MISVQTELIRAFAFWKNQTGISNNARVLFLRQKGGTLTVKGSVTEYFFIEQNKEVLRGETVFYLRLLNNAAVRELLANSTAACVRNVNPLYDNYLFNLSEQETVPSEGFAILRRQIMPTSDKYDGLG